MEAKAVKTDTKCIVRDTVHLVGGDTPGEEVFYLRQMQRSHTRPKEEWGVGCVTWFKSRIWGGSSRSLSVFGQSPCIFHT